MNPAGERLEAVHSRADGVPLGIPAPGTPDANGDGVADTNDLSIILVSVGKVAGDPGYTVTCDIDQDGDIDGKDYDAVSGWLGGTMGESKLSSSVTKSRKGFAGYEHDGRIDTLAHVRHRVYQVALGRWGTRDPLGFVDGPNLYGYVRGNPGTWVDQSSQITSPPTPAPSGPGIAPSTPTMPPQGPVQVEVCVEWEPKRNPMPPIPPSVSGGPWMSRSARMYVGYIGLTAGQENDGANVTYSFQLHRVTGIHNGVLLTTMIDSRQLSSTVDFSCIEGVGRLSGGEGRITSFTAEDLLVTLELRTSKGTDQGGSAWSTTMLATIEDQGVIPGRPDAPPAAPWLLSMSWSVSWRCQRTRREWQTVRGPNEQ